MPLAKCIVTKDKTPNLIKEDGRFMMCNNL